MSTTPDPTRDTVSKLTHTPPYQVLPLFQRKTRKESLLQLNLTYEECYVLETLFNGAGFGLNYSFPPSFIFERYSLAAKMAELSKARVQKRSTK